MSDDLERLKRLGAWRARPERLAPAAGDLSGMAREIRRTRCVEAR